MAAPESTRHPLADVLPDTARVGPDHHLRIGGLDTVALAAEYGTPLYVYDAATIRYRIRAYRDGLATEYGGASLVCYAAKALCAPWLLRMVADEGIGLDVVSGGELHVAASVQFPMELVYFHGNHKSEDELRAALALGVGRVVVDNLDELDLLSGLAGAAGKQQAILLRVTPGVEAHTHEYIKTGVLDTKFGFSIATGAAAEAVERALRLPGLDLRGLHSHIGSQIFELEPYREATRRVLGFAAEMRARFDLALQELSPGGGFGIRYVAADDAQSPEASAATVAHAVADVAEELGFDRPLPHLTIEPGRSIVGPAGVALYRVGPTKVIPGVRTYVSIDGGMADNIRPTTYGAVYSALLANRADEPPTTTVAIAGKYCESGDVLIRDAHLPELARGDLLAVPASGAYNLAMASNYNLALRPAVVVVEDGTARLVARRETFEDLLRTAVG